MSEQEQKYQTKLTKEELSKWIARLRDPNSKQYRDGYCDNGYFNNGGNIAMCCIAHGQYAISDQLHSSKTFDIFFAFNNDVKDRLVQLNDVDMRTLPQIADWIDAHLLPADIL